MPDASSIHAGRNTRSSNPSANIEILECARQHSAENFRFNGRAFCRLQNGIALFSSLNPSLGMATPDVHDGEEENSMSTEAGVFPGSSLPMPPVPPPSYEQCTAKPAAPHAAYILSPLAMATLFDWDDDED
jgi:hypothetical protein